MGKIRGREKKRGGDWQEGWQERGREGGKREGAWKGARETPN